MAEIPDLIKLREIPADYAQRLDTDLLETSTFQEATATQPGFARFDLQQKGFLHSQSKLFVSCTPSAADSFFPANVGIGSLIERAVLKAGNQVLNEISDWNHFQVMKSAQVDNEGQVDRELYLTGRCINHKFIFQERENHASELNTHQAPYYGLDNGRDYSLDGANEGSNLLQLPFAKLETGRNAESPVFSIELSDLFPFLRVHSLPLYMIKEPLYIEIHWSPLSDRVLTADGTAVQSVSIDTTELKFAADYIFYTDAGVMDRYAEQNPLLEFTFPDYRLSKRSVNQAQLTAGIVANVGMANRLVSRVLTTIQRSDLAASSIMGEYNMTAPEKLAGSTNQNSGALEYNVRYNDRFEFPISIDNKARAFTHLIQSEGPLFVTRQEYSNEQHGITQFEYEGHDQDSIVAGLAGKFFVVGTKLTSGRVGQRGIEVHFKCGAYGAHAFVMRTYSEYMRLARLEGGNFSVFNA